MKKFNEIYAEALKNESLRNELTQAVAEKKLADFLKAHDCNSDTEEIIEFLENQQAKANRGDIELNIDDLEDVAGGANRFIATLLAGLTLATTLTPVAAAAAEAPVNETSVSFEVDEEDFDIDFDELLPDEKTSPETEAVTTEAEETATTTEATTVEEQTTTTTTEFNEVVLPTIQEEKEKDFASKLNDFMDQAINSGFKLGKEKLGENLPTLTSKLFDAVPGLNYLNKVGLGSKAGELLAKVLGIAPEKAPSMKDISNQLKELSKEVENAKNAIIENADNNLYRTIEAMETVSTVNEYKSGMQELGTPVAEALSRVNTSANKSEAEQLVELASIVRTSDYWTNRGTLMFSLVNVGSFISGQQNFMSNKSFYDSLYDLAVQEGAIFSGQAKNEVEEYVNSTLRTYTTAYSVAMASLDAQEVLANIKDEGYYQEFLESLPASSRDQCRAIQSTRSAIESKRKELANLFAGVKNPDDTSTDESRYVKTVLGQYEQFMSRSSNIVISREGRFTKETKDLTLSSASIQCDTSVSGTSAAPYQSICNSNKSNIDFDVVLKYAKEREMSIAEVLESANFEIPENTKYLLADSKVSKETGNESGSAYYGYSCYDDIYTVQAYDIFSKTLKPEKVQIKTVYHRSNYVGSKEYKDPLRLTNNWEINFLTFNEKTDISISSIGKITNISGKQAYSISSGKYNLSENIKTDKPIVIEAGAKATIDLNGFTIDCTNNEYSAIIVESGANVTIRNGILKGYNSSSTGGAVFINEGAVCTMEDITAEGCAAVKSGVVRDEGTLYVRNCVFNNNGATTNCGAIDLTSRAKAEIRDSKFTNCKAGNQGGVIHNSGFCEVFDSEFTGNHADDGGAIYNDDNATLNLYNVTMTNNYTDSKGGGAICNHGELRIEGFEFKNNTSGGNGGAVWTNTSLYLENGTMDGNESKITGDDNGGGAIYVDKGSLEIHDATISNNKCSSDGGAIMCDSYKATIKVYDTDFTGNYAPSDGGAIKTKAGSVIFTKDFTTASNEFRNCTFTDNKADNKGGALDLAGSSTTIFFACTIKNNTCTKGSALRYDSQAKYDFREGSDVIGSIY